MARCGSGKGQKDGFEDYHECINAWMEYCISVVRKRLIVGELYLM